MKLRDHNVIKDVLMVSINFVLFRFDAFLQNLINFSIFSIYQISFLSLMNGMNGHPINISLSMLIITMSCTHYLYAITYAVNDFINFYDDKALSYDPEKYSFYKFRFIQYIGRRLEGFILQIFYYAALAAISLNFLKEYNVNTYYVITLILIFFLLSVVESFSKKRTVMKHISFTLQQIMKMFSFSYLLSTGFLGTYNIFAFTIFLLWGLIFIGYVILRSSLENIYFDYYLSKGSVFNMFRNVWNSLGDKPFTTLLSFSPYLVMIILCVYISIVNLTSYTLKIFVPAGISHLILVPVWVFYFILAKIFGEKDRNIYQLLRRLVFKCSFLMIYFIVLFVILF
jgi:hypothetical protein